MVTSLGIAALSRDKRRAIVIARPFLPYGPVPLPSQPSPQEFRAPTRPIEVGWIVRAEVASYAPPERANRRRASVRSMPSRAAPDGRAGRRDIRTQTARPRLKADGGFWREVQRPLVLRLTRKRPNFPSQPFPPPALPGYDPVRIPLGPPPPSAVFGDVKPAPEESKIEQLQALHFASELRDPQTRRRCRKLAVINPAISSCIFRSRPSCRLAPRWRDRGHSPCRGPQGHGRATGRR
jgi:hypothetical protein